MTTSNHPTQNDISLMEEKDESMMVEASLMGSIDTRSQQFKVMFEFSRARG
jgi:hypothetical protein